MTGLTALSGLVANFKAVFFDKAWFLGVQLEQLLNVLAVPAVELKQGGVSGHKNYMSLSRCVHLLNYFYI